jgi:hypothetical protein
MEPKSAAGARPSGREHQTVADLHPLFAYRQGAKGLVNLGMPGAAARISDAFDGQHAA